MRAKSGKKVAPDAVFVFKGTIKQPKASNVKQAPASDRTAIVTVNQVIDAPANLAAYEGQDITVELSNARKVRVGQKKIFYATSWLYAETIAVRSLREEADASEAMTHHLDATVQRDQRETRAHFDDADLVISGRVEAVRLPSVGVTGKKKATARDESSTRVSEHDPKWREAIIDVEQVHKGSLSKGRVIVRFPSSTDVAWRQAPKFEAGQQGYFVLHKENRSAARRPSASKKSGQDSSGSVTASVDTYLVCDPHDFQRYNEIGGIKSLIESESVSDKQ